eukprot:1266851-Rhodomonas_salina.1
MPVACAWTTLRVSCSGVGGVEGSAQERVEGVGEWFGAWGLEFKVWGLGFGVWGLGFRVKGLGFRPEGPDRRDRRVPALWPDQKAARDTVTTDHEPAHQHVT